MLKLIQLFAFIVLIKKNVNIQSAETYAVDSFFKDYYGSIIACDSQITDTFKDAAQRRAPMHMF